MDVVADYSIYSVKTENSSSAAAFRQFSRQKQIDSRVEGALQILKDRDEEGRSLPEELTADDVGLLVLRRAEPEDLSRIKKLKFFSTINRKDSKPYTSSLDSPRVGSSMANDSPKMGKLPFLLTGTGNDGVEASSSSADNTEFVSRLWSSSSIVLLLCHAIAAYEDPPLGCAVLTLGFSMEQGCLLRLAQIASEPHLPIERFIECLQNFASCMKCGLETQPFCSEERVNCAFQGWI
jgi:hypothetical protein